MKSLKVTKLFRDKITELFSVDCRTLGIFRIAVGCLLLINYSIRFPDILAHYSDLGVFPRTSYLDWYSFRYTDWTWSVHMINGHPLFMIAIVVVAMLCAFLLLVGYRSRLMTFLSWLFYYSICMRNPFVNYGGDYVTYHMLFWTMFIPWNVRYSVDRLIDCSGSSPSKRILSMATTALLVQMFLVYFFSGWTKTGVDWTVDGTAVFYSLTKPRFAKPLADILLQYPELLRHLTFFVRRLEVYGALLLFAPFFTQKFRMFLFGLYAVLQLGFHFCLDLGLFPLVSIIFMIPFLGDEVWDFARKIIGGNGITKWRWLQKSRHFLETNIPKRKLRLSSSKVAQTIVAVALLFSILSVADTHKVFGYQLPKKILGAKVFLGLSQRWDMFAPNPSHHGGWYVVPGRLRNGSVVDLFQNGARVSFEQPNNIYKLYSSMRWRMFMTRLRPKKNISGGFNLKTYASFLCHDWNSRNKASKQLNYLKVYIMRREAFSDGTFSDIKKTELIAHKCQSRTYKKRAS